MDRTKNHLSVRIESVEVMKMMDALSKRKDAYKSKNEIINRALEMAIPELYNAVFEKKVKKTTQENLVKIAQILNVTVDYLVGNSEEKSNDLDNIELLFRMNSKGLTEEE